MGTRMPGLLCGLILDDDRAFPTVASSTRGVKRTTTTDITSVYVVTITRLLLVLTLVTSVARSVGTADRHPGGTRRRTRPVVRGPDCAYAGMGSSPHCLGYGPNLDSRRWALCDYRVPTLRRLPTFTAQTVSWFAALRAGAGRRPRLRSQHTGSPLPGGRLVRSQGSYDNEGAPLHCAFAGAGGASRRAP